MRYELEEPQKEINKLAQHVHSPGEGPAGKVQEALQQSWFFLVCYGPRILNLPLQALRSFFRGWMGGQKGMPLA